MNKHKTIGAQLLSGASLWYTSFLFLFITCLSGPGIFAQSVSAGSMSHSSYAIDASGNLHTWGKNQAGQLGDATTTNDSTPVMVDFPAGVTKWIKVVAGDNHALAIGDDGNVYAWGSNSKGQLGNGTTNDTTKPVMVQKPSGVNSWTAIAAGASNSFAIGDDGNLYAWGYNNFGQLGNGTKSDTTSPVVVGLPTGVKPVQLSSGAYFNSALCDDGNIYGFGQGNNGQIGNGTTAGDGSVGSGNYGTPTTANMPAGVTSWKSYATGASYVVAIGSNDSLYAWGYNGTGELGVVTGTNNNPNPVNVVLPAGVTASVVAAGHNHTLIVAKNNIVFSWGRNLEGQLGINSLSNQATPVQTGLLLGKLPSSEQIAAGGNTNVSYYLQADGKLYDWGRNNNGQLGDGTSNNSTVQLLVSFPSGVTGWYAVAGGANHTLAIGDDGNIYSWGINSTGELGDSTTTSSSTAVMVHKPSGVTFWTAIAAGNEDSYAIGSDGNMYAWGRNNFGEIGDGTSGTDRLVPVKVDLPSGVRAVKISAGANCAMAIGSDDTLYAWGRNANGQLGDGTKTDRYSPVVVQMPSGVTATNISSGGYFNSALGSDGNIYAWGQGNNGQIGDGTTNSPSTPTMANKPSSVTSWKGLVTGAIFVLEIADNDSVYGWGYGQNGELGSGTNTVNNTTMATVQIPDGITVMQITAGHNHGIAMGSDGNLYAWGKNSYGQLGNSSTSNSLVPIRVLKAGELPAAPALYTPASGDTLAVADTMFTWGKVYSGNSFKLQIATDNQFSSMVVDSSGITDTLLDVADIIKLTLSSGTEYFWRVDASNANGEGSYSEVRSFVTAGITGINNITAVPNVYELSQNYPNPFNPSTRIKYSIPKAGIVTLNVYDVLGQKVTTLVNKQQEAGSYEVNFDASRLASGIYFYTLSSGTFSSVKKMILLK